MNSTAYINGQVLTRGQLARGLAIVVNGERIERLIPQKQAIEEGCTTIDLEGKTVLPGFIDTQVNGGGGVLFNESPDLAGIQTISEAHWQFGTTALLPTLISDELDIIRCGITAVDDAIDQGVPGVVGIHIEGPFLAHDRRGVHDARKIQQLTAGIISELEPARSGKTMLTLAPETVPPELIRLLTEKGFIVCAGHSNASHKQVSRAVQSGLRGFTHLYNAMSQLGSREPGMVGAALDEENTWCGIIADNHHVSPTALRVAYACKGPGKLMLVTDAMPVVGSGQDEFYLMGKKITVSDGVCRDPDDTLAGTALDMASAVRNMMKDTRCNLAEASCMASSTPAAFLSLNGDRGSIEAGKRADLVFVDQALNVLTTLIGGKTVYSAQPR